MPAGRRSSPRHRRGIGLDARWLGPEALRERFDVEAGGALLTRQAARVDPYRLTYALLQRLRRRGGHVHDRTVLHSLDATARGVAALILSQVAGP